MFRLWSVFLAVLFLAGTVALADDVQPPPWRGQWSTTFQYWEFFTPDPGQPDGPGVRPDGPGPLIEGEPGEPYIQPGYLPSTQLWVTPGPEMGWIPVDQNSGREGIWPLS